MPDDAAAPLPAFDGLMAACASGGTPTERRVAIAGAVEAVAAAVREQARTSGQPLERAWRDVLGRIRDEMRQPRETPAMAGLLLAQTLVLARAFPAIGPDSLRTVA
jgi:hypothetical protein